MEGSQCLKAGISFSVVCFLMPDRQLCLVYLSLAYWVYHAVLIAALIHTSFAFHIFHVCVVHYLEFYLQTVLKLKSSLCLFVRQPITGSANKIPSRLLDVFKVEFDLQSLTDFQGPGVWQMAPICVTPTVWEECMGFQEESQWHPLSSAWVHPFLCSTKFFPSLDCRSAVWLSWVG